MMIIFLQRPKNAAVNIGAWKRWNSAPVCSLGCRIFIDFSFIFIALMQAFCTMIWLNGVLLIDGKSYFGWIKFQHRCFQLPHYHLIYLTPATIFLWKHLTFWDRYITCSDSITMKLHLLVKGWKQESGFFKKISLFINVTEP